MFIQDAIPVNEPKDVSSNPDVVSNQLQDVASEPDVALDHFNDVSSDTDVALDVETNIIKVDFGNNYIN